MLVALIIITGFSGLFNVLIGWGQGDFARVSLGGCIMLVASCLAWLYEKTEKK